MINDLVAKDHAVDQLRVETGQAKPVLAVVLREGRLAYQDWLGAWEAKCKNVLGVLGEEALEVAGVVRVKLTLCEALGVEDC